MNAEQSITDIFSKVQLEFAGTYKRFAPTFLATKLEWVGRNTTAYIIHASMYRRTSLLGIGTFLMHSREKELGLDEI